VEEGLVAQLVVGQRVFPTHRLPDLVRDQIGYVGLHLAALVLGLDVQDQLRITQEAN